MSPSRSNQDEAQPGQGTGASDSPAHDGTGGEPTGTGAEGPAQDYSDALAASEGDADRSFSDRAADNAVFDCPLRPKHWVEFVLLEGTVPCASEACQLKLSDSRTVSGTLDNNGRVRVEAIAVAGKCTIQFPAIDKKRGGTFGDIPKGASAYVPGKPASGRTGQSTTLVLPDWDTSTVELQGAGTGASTSAGSGGSGPEPEQDSDNQTAGAGTGSGAGAAEPDWDVGGIALDDDAN